jgi:hypothetical protein
MREILFALLRLPNRDRKGPHGLPPSHTTGQTGHEYGGAVDCVRVSHHPNRGVGSRRASGPFIPSVDSSGQRLTGCHQATPPEATNPCYPSGLPPISGGTMPSADCCGAVRADGSALSPSQDTPQISRGQRSYRPCLDAGLIKHAPAVDGGLCCRVPARPERATPHIRFVSLAPHVRSTRPSDPTSR